MRALFVAGAALALLAARPAPPLQDEDRLSIDSITEDFQHRWDKAESEKDWPELLKLFDGAVERYPRQLAQPDPEVRRWLRMPAVLGDRLASVLPEKHREDREIVAQQLLDSVQDRTLQARIVDKYGYTRAGRRAIELAANADYDEGRLRDAVRGWSRALSLRLSPELVARLGNAHAASGDQAALAALRAQAEKANCRGAVTVGGRRCELQEFLAGLQKTAAPAADAAAPLQKPRPPALPSTEISLGFYDLKTDGGSLGRRDGSSKEWGMRPGIVTADGRDRVLLTNGLRVISLDPEAAESGTLENAVQWRWPKDGNVRYWMPTIYGIPQPVVGVSSGGGRAFVTMFSAQSRQGQVGRRPDRFEGPGALRALDPATGAILWDTDTVEIEIDGSRRKMIEELPFGRLNFCFAGPPLVREDRLYAAAMTVTPDRQCYIVCLDPVTGSPRWCTWIGTAPATRERTSVPAFAEEDGTLVVCTNFGLVAALDSDTGAIDWLVKYRGQGNRTAVNPPVFHHSLVYILAQDSDEPLVYDRWTGREASLPEPKEPVSWLEVARLVGRSRDWLVFTGARNLALHAATGQVVSLGESDCPRPTGGLFRDGLLYLPTKTMLHVYDTATWKRIESFPWTGGDDSGHFVLGESTAAYVGERLELFTGAASLKQRFGSKVDATPPRAEPCRQLARILEGSGRLKESVAYYRRALGVWERDPAWSERTEEMRKKLADLAEKMGDEFPKE